MQANEVFVALPPSVVLGLEGSGFRFYRWPACRPANGVAVRFVTSYVTTAEETDGFLQATRKAFGGFRDQARLKGQRDPGRAWNDCRRDGIAD